MKAENLKSRAKEEFDLDMQLQTFGDNETFDFHAAREEVRILKEKIRALGAVNFAAFDEYKSEKERLDFVNAQRKDLVESEQTPCRRSKKSTRRPSISSSELSPKSVRISFPRSRVSLMKAMNVI